MFFPGEERGRKKPLEAFRYHRAWRVLMRLLDCRVGAAEGCDLLKLILRWNSMDTEKIAASLRSAAPTASGHPQLKPPRTPPIQPIMNPRTASASVLTEPKCDALLADRVN
jgi:hypothetical protein